MHCPFVHHVFRQDHRHPIVHMLKGRIGGGRDDGERWLPLAGRGLPGLAEPSQQKQATVRSVGP